jgi:tripartite-type tricarboxylate transporter receptor subunit TctC
MKQVVIVENKPGLPDDVGGEERARRPYADADLQRSHHRTRYQQGHLVRSGEGFRRGDGDRVGAAGRDRPRRSAGEDAEEFIALASASPGKLNFSSAGLASTSFLSADFPAAGQDQPVHVHKGVPDATTAVIRGDVQMYFAPIPNARELAASGKVRALAINSDKRAAQLPDVPTIAEAAVPGYKYESWFGLMAPAGTPRAILTKVSRDVAFVLGMEDVRDRLTKYGSIPAPTTPERFDAIIKNDTARYSKVLRDAGVVAK